MGTAGTVAGTVGDASEQTDSPVGHLHVLGQCQTKRIRCLRKRRAEVSHNTPCMLLTRCGSRCLCPWSTMVADVEAFVRSCRVCAGTKTNTHLRMVVQTFSEVSVTPFSHWDMDLISMPMSPGGHDLIATWVDRTSKTIVAQALKESVSTSQDLARLTFEVVCC
jgi:hypothetical protein